MPDSQKFDWQQFDWRAVVFTAIALVAAWLAWIFSPRLFAWVGLSDLELLGQFGAVVVVLTIVEQVFTRLWAARAPPT